MCSPEYIDGISGSAPEAGTANTKDCNFSW